MCGGAYPSSGADKDYRAESDHSVLSRAEEIRSDKARMSGVKKHHRKETKRLAGVSRTLTSGKR